MYLTKLLIIHTSRKFYIENAACKKKSDRQQEMNFYKCTHQAHIAKQT